MIILSWDVGIKNLAYCKISYENDKINIIDWDIINLIDDNKCHGFINSDETINNCNRKCCFKYQNGSDLHYFCMIHKNQFQKINQEILEMKKYKGKEICCKKLSNKKQCSKIGSFSLDKKKYCKLHANLIKKKQNLICKINNNVNKIPINFLKINLVNKFDKLKNVFLDCDYICIENQPSLKNPKMKSIAETIFNWFLIRGYIDKDINKSNIKKIFYISPSNKLKIDDDDIQKQINLITQNKRYQFTKKMAIIYTQKNIYNQEKWVKFLDSNKKKDDLCDAYLQGRYFISKINKYDLNF